MVQSIYSGNAVEAKTRMKTPDRTSCACWMSIAVAVLVLLIALILALEPQMFRRVYTLSNNAPRQAGYDHPSHYLFLLKYLYHTYYVKLFWKW